ncbi:protein yippee-like 1 isoform X2 [Petromyzon marinus]|uniref:protein yippee-like 1 isoform X2 n=1 Tax=Petromyzon marinus TaxID=7757 RepID=UPI003F6F0709
MVKLTKSKTFQAYLPNCHRKYSCVHCRAHLANHDELISKSFQGSQGRAYLFNSVWETPKQATPSVTAADDADDVTKIVRYLPSSDALKSRE